MSQVPFEFAVKEVLEQLRKIAKGEYKTPDTGKRKFGTIVYAAVTLPVTEIKTLLHTVSENTGALSNSLLKHSELSFF